LQKIKIKMPKNPQSQSLNNKKHCTPTRNSSGTPRNTNIGTRSNGSYCIVDTQPRTLKK
jgi:hypothetical protein